MINKHPYILALLLLGCAQVAKKPISKDLSHLTFNRTLSFPTVTEASSYFYDRRLQLQRFYELNAEPYFGTPKEKDCRNSVDTTAKVNKLNTGQHFSMKMLVNDNLALGDCLPENNTMVTIYEFKQCLKTVHESRTYFNLGNEPALPTKSECP